MRDTTTHGIRIQVQTRYVEERSDTERGFFFFAYHVVLSNEEESPAILDALGVRGPR